MGFTFPFSTREARLVFFVTLLLLLGFCYCYDKSVEVNGLVECYECSENNLESSNVLSGHQVLVSCKVDDEQFETRGVGEIKEGKFKIALPNEMVDDEGQLKQECFAQLQNIASSTTCPSFDDELEASKIVFQSIENGKHMLGTKGKLELSPTVCSSAFLKHYFLKHPLLKKHFKKYHHPLVHKKPIFHKPFPPKLPIPGYKPEDSVLPVEPLTVEGTDPLLDDNHFLHHKKHIPHYPFHKPIPKIPIVHYKPIPKIPHPPLHKHPHIPVIPPDHHA